MIKRVSRWTKNWNYITENFNSSFKPYFNRKRNSIFFKFINFIFLLETSTYNTIHVVITLYTWNFIDQASHFPAFSLPLRPPSLFFTRSMSITTTGRRFLFSILIPRPIAAESVAKERAAALLTRYHHPPPSLAGKPLWNCLH